MIYDNVDAVTLFGRRRVKNNTFASFKKVKTYYTYVRAARKIYSKAMRNFNQSLCLKHTKNLLTLVMKRYF